MRRLWTSGVMAVVGLAVLGTYSPAQVATDRKIAVRISPLPERVALAETIVTGKVTAIEDKKVEARQFPGAKDKVEFTIAVVKIEDALLNAKGITHVKIGFVEPQAAPGGGPGIRPGRFPQVNLNKDQEGCFLLRPHFEESFLTLPGYDYVLTKKDNPNYEKEMETIKRCAKLLADTDAGLKAKSADDRFQTAGMLLIRYRTPQGANPKEEKIDAKESKLILQGLADGDWTKGFSATELTPMMVFGRLALTDKDGWKPGPFQNYEKEFPEAAKKWLKDNADSYVIKRFAEETKKEKKE
jgi:hypothetical protein